MNSGVRFSALDLSYFHVRSGRNISLSLVYLQGIFTSGPLKVYFKICFHVRFSTSIQVINKRLFACFYKEQGCHWKPLAGKNLPANDNLALIIF